MRRQTVLRLDHSIRQQVLEVYQVLVDKVVRRVVGAARGWGLSVHRFILLRSELTFTPALCFNLNTLYNLVVRMPPHYEVTNDN